MSTLHLLNESPYKGTSLNSALLFATLDDVLLLTGDAVYALQKNTAPYQLLAKSQLPIFVLQEDLQARHLENSLVNSKIIDYQEFVELSIFHNKVVSWL